MSFLEPLYVLFGDMFVFPIELAGFSLLLPLLVHITDSGHDVGGVVLFRAPRGESFLIHIDAEGESAAVVGDTEETYDATNPCWLFIISLI